MSRALLLVGCLLCLALPATVAAGPAALGGSDPAATEPTPLTNGTTPMLSVSPPAAQGHNATEFDPGIAFSMGGDELQRAFDRHRYAAALENASTDAERRAVVSDALDDLREQVDALRQRERAAATEYAAGAISERAFLRELARVHSSAGTLQRAVEPMIAASQDADATDLIQRANTLSQAAESLTGPIRGSLAAGVRSQAGSAAVYAAATDAGVVLATVESGAGETTYVREAVRFDNRDDEQSTTFASASDFYEFMAERYPEATSGPPSLSIEFPGSIHRFDVRHADGSLTTYVDGSTRGVFRDVHTLRVGDLPAGESVNATGDGLSITVNRTFPTGPARVTVRGEGDAPVDATVSVANRTVGTTGFDGSHWAVVPDGEYAVTATRGDESVTVTVG